MINVDTPFLEDSFLRALREGEVPVFIYLTNGVKLHGIIEAYDSNSLLLQDYVGQLVFKHAISTIVPQEPFEFPVDL